MISALRRLRPSAVRKERPFARRLRDWVNSTFENGPSGYFCARWYHNSLTRLWRALGERQMIVSGGARNVLRGGQGPATPGRRVGQARRRSETPVHSPPYWRETGRPSAADAISEPSPEGWIPMRKRNSVDSIWFLSEKSGFPFRTPAFCSVSRGQRRLGEKEYRCSVTPGVALRPRTQGKSARILLNRRARAAGPPHVLSRLRCGRNQKGSRSSIAPAASLVEAQHRAGRSG